MIWRRPTRRRSNPRDNRWRGTLPEANILIRKLLGLSTNSHLSFVIASQVFDQRRMTSDQ
jgi:hypothetical protein